MAVPPFLLLIATLIFSQFSSATDTMTQLQSLSIASTLVSRDGSFELGFFRPGKSRNYYLGIWYKTIPVRTVVWVANRKKPIKNRSCSLRINGEQNLVLVTRNESVIWSSAKPKAKALNPIAQLLGYGNFVLRDKNDENPENYLWQSFDYPSDTLLAGMKLGWDWKSGINRRLSAWKNWDDPSPGDFNSVLEHHINPEVVMWQGRKEISRSGPWNGIRFSGSPELKSNPFLEWVFVNNSNEAYYAYSLKNQSVISRIVMNQTLHSVSRYNWIAENQSWRLYSSMPTDHCDIYNVCGPFGICVVTESPVCQCLRGFKPKLPNKWNVTDWSQGCVRSEPWSCREKDKDGFLKFSGIKLPDTSHSWVDGNMTLEECRAKCWENCSCTAYASLDVTGVGCAMWFNNLLDLRQISGDGQDLYIRMAATDQADHEKSYWKRIKIAVVHIIILLVLGMLLTFFYMSTKKIMAREKTMPREQTASLREGQEEDLELPVYDLATIAYATNEFSSDNKLGEGGFGSVYRGTLQGGEEIAIKRLSESSRQGLNEFKNEVTLCVKLQHRNLVKVLGCCIEREEKMLIYEYMPNKSLDSILFDPVLGKLLYWSKRYQIIRGVARGLLYLHQDSRLRIIHGDLKASNILLDSELNPKISDFGIARTLSEDQIEGNTTKVVGTFGYMAPEYAFDGLFSVKSDVFSFGILLLEIVIGKKNRALSHAGHTRNLIGHAWRMWKEGIPTVLIDPCLGDSCNVTEALRCIHIGLLCAQQHPNDRPNMATVVVMLSSDGVLPQPKEPGFLLEKSSLETGTSSGQPISCTNNDVTMTQLEPR